MKLLFVYYLPSGGVETLNRQRCSALQKIGVHSELLYLQNGEGIKNIISIPVHVTNNDSEIQNLLLKGNYDAIIVCSDHHFLLRLKKLGYKGKIIYEVQGLGSKSDANAWLRGAQKIINSSADAILFPKTAHIKELCTTYFPHKPKFSFHNSFDTETFSYHVLPKEAKPIVGWVGRLEENKNWRGFVNLARKLILQIPSIQLWMFEDATLASPEERAEFQLLIGRYGLANHLTIRSNIPNRQMADYYSKIGDSGGFLCSTSKVEGFGYAIVEAMSCRCPVLTTDSDGVRSFIIHNQTGKFFDNSQHNNAVIEALELITNVELREKIRSNGLHHIQTHLSPNIYCQNFLQMMNVLGVNK
ncbi:glycosyltransferase family 4 protein [Pseudalkalibacillus hwajinpoensis]|uniref:glycosyltransferase family 4 protein n=1 Tax=Guptibacillus hwajinpoensis TaxID=208199 RepID=UPI00325AF3F1